METVPLVPVGTYAIQIDAPPAVTAGTTSTAFVAAIPPMEQDDAVGFEPAQPNAAMM
jgi:hypothetical protein